MAEFARILHVNKYVHRRGGAESYMLDLAQLQERDTAAQVAFFGMQHPSNNDARYQNFFPPEMTLRPMPSGLKAQVGTGLNMIWNRYAARGIEAVVEQFQPDVAHLHNIYHQLSPSVLRPLAARGVPIVMTLHDYKLACPAYQFMRDGQPCTECLGGSFLPAVKNKCGGSTSAGALLALESSIHRRGSMYDAVDVLHCPSRFLRSKMVEAGLPADRLVHLPLFRKTEDGTSVGESGEITAGPASGSYALYAGRLAVEKGVDTAISAIGRIENGELVVAGDGPERENLERLAARVAPGRVHFLGHVTHERVEGLLAQARFAVVPSRWFENQPLSILDAMGAGRPVIGSGLGGIAELIHNEVDGLLVAPGDVDAWSTAMTSLFANGEWAANLGAAAARKISEEHHPKRHLDGVFGLYETAARNRLARAF